VHPNILEQELVELNHLCYLLHSFCLHGGAHPPPPTSRIVGGLFNPCEIFIEAARIDKFKYYPAVTIFMVTPTEAQQTAKRFIDEYVKPPFDDYLGPIGTGPMANVGSPDGLLARIRNSRIVGGRLPTKPSKEDNLEDWCLIIGIRKRLSSDIDLPSGYHGVKVFYYRSGEVKLY
jgi:hypothetical protein